MRGVHRHFTTLHFTTLMLLLCTQTDKVQDLGLSYYMVSINKYGKVFKHTRLVVAKC